MKLCPFAARVGGGRAFLRHPTDARGVPRMDFCLLRLLSIRGTAKLSLGYPHTPYRRPFKAQSFRDHDCGLSQLRPDPPTPTRSFVSFC
jgi:hypothetical protein